MKVRQCVASLPTPVEYLGDSQLRHVINSIVRITTSANNTATHLNAQLIPDHVQTTATGPGYVYNFVSFTVNPPAVAGALQDPHGFVPAYRLATHTVPWFIG